MKLGGKPYRQIVAQHVASAFGRHGLEVYEEVDWGSSIIGKHRRVDILVIDRKSGAAVALQTKYQDAVGTADDQEARRARELEG